MAKERPKGGKGYKAARWRDWVRYECEARGCQVNSDSRPAIEQHVAVVHGIAQPGADDVVPTTVEGGDV